MKDKRIRILDDFSNQNGISVDYKISLSFRSSRCFVKDRKIELFVEWKDLLNFSDMAERQIIILSHEIGHAIDTSFDGNVLPVYFDVVFSTTEYGYFDEEHRQKISELMKDKKWTRIAISKVLLNEHRAWINARNLLDGLNINYSKKLFKSIRSLSLNAYRSFYNSERFIKMFSM